MTKNGVSNSGKTNYHTLRRGARRLMSLPALLLSMTALIVLTSRPAPGQTRSNSHPKSEQTQTTLDEWKRVEQVIGKAGAVQPGGVFKISLPRSDLRVTVKGVLLKPALALGSWLAFKKMGDEAVVMGDLVLTEDEVSAVMAGLQQGGIEETGLHNHVLNESPRVMYMHIKGHGDPLKMAETIHAALALSKTPFTAPSSAALPQSAEMDTKRLDQIMRHSGKANGGVYQFSIPRAEKIMDGVMEVSPSMGVATAINFQPTGEGHAAVTGDFVLLAGEVNPVIRALRENGIDVTALHSHMLMEEPRLFFMHFWANDDAIKLARGLRAALDKTNSVKEQAR